MNATSSSSPERAAFERVGWLVLHPVLVHLAAVLAVALASFKLLNIWRAVSTLSARSTSDADDEPAPSTRTFTALKASMKKFNALPLGARSKKLLVGLSCFLPGLGTCLGTYVFFVWVVPNFTSQGVQDGIFGTALCVMHTVPANALLDVVYPLPSQVRYRRVTPPTGGATSQPEPEAGVEADRAHLVLITEPIDRQSGKKQVAVRFLVSLSIAVGTLVFTSLGHTAHMPLVAFGFVLFYVGTMKPARGLNKGGRMKISTIVLWISGFLTSVPIISILLGLLLELITGPDADKNDADKKDSDHSTVPSDWIIQLILVFVQVSAVIVPAVVTSMTLRFEHSLNSSIDGLNAESESESESERAHVASPPSAVAIPSSTGSFPKPIFLSSLFSLALSLAVVDALTIRYTEVQWLALTPVSLWITAPIVFAGTALAAACRGQLGAWWRYTEIWIPSSQKLVHGEPVSVAKSNDEAELALLSHDELKEV